MDDTKKIGIIAILVLIAVIASVVSIIYSLLIADGKIKTNAKDNSIDNTALKNSEVFDVRGINLSNSSGSKIYLYNNNRNLLVISDTSNGNEDYLLNWNYIRDQTPWFGGSTGYLGNGFITENMSKFVFVTKDTLNVIFPNFKGLGPTRVSLLFGSSTLVGATIYPWVITGNIPQKDEEDLSVGLDLSIGSKSLPGSAFQMDFSSGDGTLSNYFERFVSGTDSGYIDVTVISNNWANWSNFSIGFRQEQQWQSDFPSNIAVAALTDNTTCLYKNFICLGIMTNGAINKEIMVVAAGDDKTSTAADSSQQVGAGNVRMRISLAKSGVVSFQYVLNQEAGQGTLGNSSTLDGLNYSFPNGMNVVPMIIIRNLNKSDTDPNVPSYKAILKDIKVVRYIS